MKKIPTIFKRNPDDLKHVLNEWHPKCLWVRDGEGTPTRKYDGTCCLVRDGKLYKRREIKKGRSIPDGFELADFDELTGKKVGWLPCDRNDRQDKWHFQAFDKAANLPDGTYELCGPKIQGNPEGYTEHVLVSHDDAQIYETAPRTYQELSDWLLEQEDEGIVFHHPDGRMAKIKKRDFE